MSDHVIAQVSATEAALRAERGEVLLLATSALQGREVAKLSGGMLAWQHAGLPLTTNSGAPGVVR